MMKESESKTHGWMRVAQIVLGALAIIVSLIILAYPGLTTITLVYFVSLLFFIVGIEKIITGIFFKSKSRVASIILGVIVLILAGLALAFPVGATFVLILVVAFALLFDGIARISTRSRRKIRKQIQQILQYRCRNHIYCHCHIDNGITSFWFCICRLLDRNSHFNNWDPNLSCRIKRTKSRVRHDKNGCWK